MRRQELPDLGWRSGAGRERAMERNRWEKAIRCLEVALHPNTGDDEVIAGVNGFRRTADGTRLRDICAELAGKAGDGGSPIADPAQTAALKQLRDAERRIHELSAEIQAAERSFADFRSASAQLLDGLKDENFDLRGALEQARRTTMPPAGPVASPFRELLAAARLRDGQEDAAGAPGPSETPTAGPGPRHPWTA
jgi:hypothetical protein